jgi:hypothetical protein
MIKLKIFTIHVKYDVIISLENIYEVGTFGIENKHSTIIEDKEEDKKEDAKNKDKSKLNLFQS